MEGTIASPPSPDSEPNPGPGPRQVRLAFGAFLWRSFVALAVLGELLLWAAIQRRAGGFPPRFRLAWLIGYTPQTLIFAFVLASVATLAVDLFVRLFVDRMLRRWLNPTTERDDEDGRGFGFHLDASERLAGTVPARRLSGMRSEPGSLVLTDRNLWFFPSTWDGEPWSVPRGRIRSARLEPTPGPMGRLLQNLPPRLVVDAEPALALESRSRFALLEPGRVLSWLQDEPAAR